MGASFPGPGGRHGGGWSRWGVRNHDTNANSTAIPESTLLPDAAFHVDAPSNPLTAHKLVVVSAPPHT